MRLTIDIETYSEADLKKAGLYRYAEHESTDLLCVCWAFDDGPVSTWIPAADRAFIDALEPGFGAIYCEPRVPRELVMAIERGDEIHAWNAAFERNVLNGPAGKRYGFPHIEITQTRCSMARSRYNSMPGSLEEAAKALGTPTQKRVSGVNAMRYLCKPRKDGTRPTIKDERERFLQLVPYCADDVRAERDVDNALPEMSPKEIQIYHMDQRINDRGVLVDLESVDNMEMLIAQYKDQLKALCLQKTGYGPTQSGKIAEWLRANGCPDLVNLEKDNVRKTLQTDIPDLCKDVLKIYSTYGMKAVSKYPAMRQAVCKDNRIRGMMQYHAASTGRFSSFIVQLHNLFRPVIDDPETAIEAARDWDLDWIRALYPGVDPMKVIASCVRGMLVAAPGKELVFPDFSGVESRWQAWMFGEEWKLEAYRAYDAGRGIHPYVAIASRTFGVAPEDVTKTLRLLGKVLDLSMGYQGGVGAFIKMATNYQIDLRIVVAAFDQLSPEIRAEAGEATLNAELSGRMYGVPRDIWLACEGLKLSWRKAHPRIANGWYRLEDMAREAIRNPGEITSVAKLAFKVEDRWLVMRLPSGRKMRYFEPRVTEAGQIRYIGVDTDTRMWGPTHTYGGKLSENQAQAGCRDFLVDALLGFDAAGHPPIFHVHDEPAVEVPMRSLSDEEVARIMCNSSPWAKDFPLAVEMHRAFRYRK